MQDWLTNAKKYCKSIEIYSSATEIHKCRSKTLAERVQAIYHAAASKDPQSINLDAVGTKGYLSMLLATFEEISDYFAMLQKKDRVLGKRVMRFGSDEETFSKWNETLKTCSFDLGLISGDANFFDSDKDLQDLNEDMVHLQANLLSILKNVPDAIGSAESILVAKQKLLAQQQNDRTEYKTQQSFKAEKVFNPKGIRYENVIGIGGIVILIVGFGEVWKARYKGDEVAVKKFPARALGMQAIASLKMEAEFMKKLSHPRIVACFGILEDSGNYCMVMELCVNGSLGSYMVNNQAQTVDWERRMEFAVDISNGMNYLHKLGVIHRDLKPGNVVLDRHYRAKITDFGLSVVKTATQTSMKLDECGTPQYMAPESFGLVPIFSTKSDVYAFSIVLWELSHWRPAYVNVAVAEIKGAIRDGDRLPIDGSVSPDIKRLITDCWADNPKLRPAFASITERLVSPSSATIGVPDKFNNLLQLTTKVKSVKKSKIGFNIRNIWSNKKYRLYAILIVLAILVLIGALVGVLVGTSSGKSAEIPASNTVTTLSTKTISRTPYPTATVSTLIEYPGLLDGIFGMTIDENDNLYVVTVPQIYPFYQSVYPVIYKVTQDLNPVVTLIANLSNDGQGFPYGEQGICYYNQGLYVPRGGKLTKIDLSNGNLVTRFAGSGKSGGSQDGANSSAVFAGAIHCTTDKYGNIYVVDYNSGTIRNVSQTGDVHSVVSLISRGQSHSFIFNGTDKLLFPTSGVLNAADGLINSLDLNTLELTILAGNTSQPPNAVGPCFDISMVHPIGIALDEIGNLYFSKYTGIWKLNSSNYVSLFAGSLFSTGLVNGVGANTMFNNLRHLVFDSNGRILAADEGNSAIRRINW